jgi:hypothetical protein
MAAVMEATVEALNALQPSRQQGKSRAELMQRLERRGAIDVPTPRGPLKFLTSRGRHAIGMAERMLTDEPETIAWIEAHVQAGDVVYVNRAPQYYIYGQVTRPGMYGLDRGMTLAQAIAKGGGLTLRGTDRQVRVHRRYGSKQVQVLEPKLDDAIRPDDLIFVRESVF